LLLVACAYMCGIRISLYTASKFSVVYTRAREVTFDANVVLL